MKKFLSLVLALIMTMSLVTISAGATEYKELTDKDEIQYEEAVAVLNRIGVITGYSDGSFRPETELTRGAAAKIIVSLLIGPEAASNLPNTFAPYPDVPANHTFAGVISYCKTAGIISGYGDGTFKPANSLTGYAFAKMLLGAIGYDSKIQGYTDTGWTMNVARDGNKAELFNRIEFDGGAAVTREQACQLALNTLKATMVEYSGGLDVTAGDAHVTSAPTLTYKISNQEYASHINNKKLGTTGNAEMSNHWTVEFGEEHFKDLRMSHDRTTNDDFGRPSNEWSYKKVTIGTFPIEPDFVYTELKIHNDDAKVTDAAKVRALELNGYELKMDGTKENEPVDTTLWLNGQEWSGAQLAVKNASPYNHYLQTVGDIADYTDNGTRVEVYVDDDDADFIRDVVVVKTQLMEVKSLKSEAVALKLYDDGSDDNYMGFNSTPINEDVNDVQVNDDCYNTLKDMKVGDIVAVIPVYTGINSKYDVSKVYVPETVSGELTNVDTYGQSTDEGEEEAAIATTVGGTDYKVALWNKDLTDIDGTKIRVTRKDVTLHLDEYGNALLAKDVGSTSNFMVVGGYHSGLVDGKVVTFVDGWDIKGNEISLNVGNIQYTGVYYHDMIGQLVHYSSDASSKYAEWDIDYLGVFDVASKRPTDDGSEEKAYSLKASSSKVLLDGWTATGTSKNGGIFDTYDFYKGNTDQGLSAKFPATAVPVTKNIDVDDSGVKVIYVTMDSDDDEVDSIEIKDGMQAISNEEILGEGSGFTRKRAQACVALKNDNTEVWYNDSVVKAIVIKEESGSANLKDLVYISNYIGSAGVAAGKDSTSKPVYGYEAHFVGSSDYDKTVTIYSYKDLRRGDFARARLATDAPTEVKNVTEENFYNLTKYGDTIGSNSEKIHKALSVLPFAQIKDILSNNKTLLRLTNYDVPTKANTGIVAKANEQTDQNGIANITWNLNAVSELDLGDESAASVVSINKAKFIDLTDNNVDSASDLKDLWNDVTDAQKKAHGDNVHRLINLTLLFNDKYDDDGFRDVHAVIITSAPKSAVYVPEGPKAGVLNIVDADNGLDSSKPLDGAEVKKDDVITVTVKDGFEVSEVKGATQTNVSGNVYTFKADSDDGVTITITKKVAGVMKFTINDNNQRADGTAKPTGEVTYKVAYLGGKSFITLSLTKVPAFVSLENGAKVKGVVNVFQNGVEAPALLYLDAACTANAVASGKEVEFTYNGTTKTWGDVSIYSALQIDGETLTIGESTTAGEKFKADKVVAQFEDAAGTTTAIANLAKLGGTAKSITSGSAVTFDGTAGKLVINTSYNYTAQAGSTAASGDIHVDSADGATISGTTTQTPWVVASDGKVVDSTTTAAANMTLTADGDDYVTITLSNTLSKAETLYSITEKTFKLNEVGVSGAADNATIKLAAKTASGLKDGATTQIEATLANGDATLAGYDVAVTVGGQEVAKKEYLAYDASGITIGNITINGADIDLADATVTVTPVAKLKIATDAAGKMKIDASQDVVKIEFTTDIVAPAGGSFSVVKTGTAADGEIIIGALSTSGSATASGKVLTINLDKQFNWGSETPNTIVFEAASVIDKDHSTNTLDTVTITATDADTWA